jgi:hypothetical protein
MDLLQETHFYYKVYDLSLMEFALLLLVPTQNAEVIIFAVLPLSEAKRSTRNILASLGLWWWQHSQFTDELHLNITSLIKVFNLPTDAQDKCFKNNIKI